MTDRARHLITIGTFSHIGRVSTRLLRHYHAVGLLVPAEIDGDNDYRLYDPAQLHELHRILALRDLGFSLEEIRRLFDAGVPDDQMRLRLEELEAETAEAQQAAQSRLRSIRARIRALDGEEVAEPLQLQSFEPIPFWSVSGTYSPAEARAVVSELFAFGQERMLAPPFVTARWTDAFDKDSWALEIGVTEVLEVGDARIELLESTLPQGLFVTTVRRLSAEHAHELYSSVPTFCDAHDLRLNGQLREVVYAMPDPATGEEPTVEVQFGVDRR